MRSVAFALVLVAFMAAPAGAAPKRAPVKPVASKVNSIKPVAAPTKVLTVFDFRGQNTRDSYNPTCAEKWAETRGDDGTYSCTDFGLVAGVPASTLTSYYNGKLSSVYATFKDFSYSPIRDAFVAKYGKPDRTDTKPWKSKGGASFDNSVTEWLFADDSVLQLESLGSKVGEGSFTFISVKNSRPKQAPKVDF